MSDYGFDRLLVDGNYVFDNHENAIYIHDASGATFIQNLLANTRDTEDFGQAVYIRRVDARTRTGHHTFIGNLLIGYARLVDVDYPAFRSGIQRFDFNLYDMTPEAQTFVINSDSDSPPPWSSDEFRDLIYRDLELTGKPALSFQASGKVDLTFSQWKQFWKRHGSPNDTHSVCSTGNSVSYDPSRHELAVTLHVDPPEIRDATDSDRNSILQHLERGAHKFTIWDSLPILGADQLPPAGWTR